MSGPVPRLGAWLDDAGARFRVWAPGHDAVEVVTYAADGRTVTGGIPLVAQGSCFAGSLEGAAPGLLYKYRVDGDGPFPDPVSRSQPFGVHGPSEIPGEYFHWHDRSWRGVPLEQLVLWEVHVGTATDEGTFEALIAKLPHVRGLGATALELMPVGSFPGQHNWGYDGVNLSAPHAGYGGPYGLRRLVDAAHAEGLGVILDVVYNHFGPAGNYLRQFSPHYFTDRHQTPWGDAINYDGPGAAVVREMVLRNAEMWIRDYHLDGLRLDASHAIHDESPRHILLEIGERARAAAPERRVLVIAEDERNEERLLRPVAEGGYGLDAVWADDFHHQLRRALAGDRDGYYRDFTGTAEDIARTVRDGWFFRGEHSEHLDRPRGTSPDGVPLPRFVHCLQNHDQVGNRALGDRLGARVEPAAFRAASALLLLSPATPLIFMGQEWNAATPFLYFTDHEEELGREITRGRRREFTAFSSFGGEHLVPDPQAVETFLQSKLDWSERESAPHAGVLEWYRELLALRRRHPAMERRDRAALHVEAWGPDAVALERRGPVSLLLVVALRGSVEHPLPRGEDWAVLLHSEEPRFGGAGVGEVLGAGGVLRGGGLRGGAVHLRGPAALVLASGD